MRQQGICDPPLKMGHKYIISFFKRVNNSLKQLGYLDRFRNCYSRRSAFFGDYFQLGTFGSISEYLQQQEEV